MVGVPIGGTLSEQEERVRLMFDIKRLRFDMSG